MTRRSRPSVTFGLAILGAASLFALPASGQTPLPKHGGILNSVLTEDPPGLVVHESATIRPHAGGVARQVGGHATR
jgi:hypothetical protein